MPLSIESKRVLAYAAKEAEESPDHCINTAHLFYSAYIEADSVLRTNFELVSI
jgi:hypothetical protein